MEQASQIPDQSQEEDGGVSVSDCYMPEISLLGVLSGCNNCHLRHILIKSQESTFQVIAWIIAS
jgi:hypothetical protein